MAKNDKKHKETKHTLTALMKTSCKQAMLIQKMEAENAQMALHVQAHTVPSGPFTLQEYSILTLDQITSLQNVPLQHNKDAMFLNMSLRFLLPNITSDFDLKKFKSEEAAKYSVLKAMFFKRVSHQSDLQILGRNTERYLNRKVSRELQRIRPKSNIDDALPLIIDPDDPDDHAI